MNRTDKIREVTFLDVAFVAATLMMFSKTADVMVFFTPLIVTEIFGNVSQYYGMANAIIVEGVMTALHFHPRATGTKHQAVKWILFGVSAVCQVYDGMITTNTITAQTDTIKAFFSNGLPLLTAFVLALILWMGKLPETDEPRKPFIGLKNIPGQFRWIWEGAQKHPTIAPQKPVGTFSSDTPRVDLAEVETKENPSPRRNGVS